VRRLAEDEGERGRDDDQRGHDACEQTHGRSFDGVSANPPTERHPVVGNYIAENA
jgi:hypothetical protein